MVEIRFLLDEHVGRAVVRALQRRGIEALANYYYTAHPHRSLDLEAPMPAASPRAPTGPICARPVLGGLHHTYARVA